MSDACTLCGDTESDLYGCSECGRWVCDECGIWSHIEGDEMDGEWFCDCLRITPPAEPGDLH